MKEEEIGRGIIRFFKNSQKYGFISDFEGGPDLFFHIRNCAETRLRFYAEIGCVKGRSIFFLESEKRDELNRRSAQAVWLAEN